MKIRQTKKMHINVPRKTLLSYAYGVQTVIDSIPVERRDLVGRDECISALQSRYGITDKTAQHWYSAYLYIRANPLL